jgi:hypothetical protein
MPGLEGDSPVTEDELQRASDQFRDVAAEARPRADCPPAERIWSAVKLALPRAERLEILDHTAECPACAEAWRIAMTFGEPAALGRRRTAYWPAAFTGARMAAAALVAIAGIVYLMTRGAAPPVDTPPKQTDAGPASPIVVSLNDGGGRVTLTESGRLTTPTPFSGDAAARVAAALHTRKLAAPQELAALKTGAGALMGSGVAEAFALVAPIATAVATDRPTLVWKALPGAVSYEITISDVAANYRDVVSSPPLRETSWTATRALARDRVYSWQVVARTPSGEVKAPVASEGEARFKVLTQEEADTIAKAREMHRDAHLVLGVLYTEAGLLDEAEGEFRALADANPDSTVPQELLRAVRELRTIKR